MVSDQKAFKMRLFDKIDRYYEGPAQYAEPKFIYLNRSARPDVKRIRDTFEAWFSKYPHDGKIDLCKRFRSTINSQHQAAFFELFLHELLRCLECKVRPHHKVMGGTEKRPDFFVKSASQSSFYIEAVLATDESQEKGAAEARKRVVYDTLDKLDSQNFFIGIEEQSGSPRTSPSGKKLANIIQKWLSNLDPDYISALANRTDFAGMPKLPYEHEGWKVTFFPIPKSYQSRGKPGSRTVGMKTTEIQIIDPRVAIRNAILSKAGRYGSIGIPYVVAVNALKEEISSDEIRRTHVMEALFGQEQYWQRRYGPNKFVIIRAPDGVWTNKSGPRYTRLSAILVTAPIHHWNIPKAPVCLYHNPWAKRPYQSQLTRLPQAIPQPDGHIKWQDGESIGGILGLPSGWPNV